MSKLNILQINLQFYPAIFPFPQWFYVSKLQFLSASRQFAVSSQQFPRQDACFCQFEACVKTSRRRAPRLSFWIARTALRSLESSLLASCRGRHDELSSCEATPSGRLSPPLVPERAPSEDVCASRALRIASHAAESRNQTSPAVPCTSDATFAGA